MNDEITFVLEPTEKVDKKEFDELKEKLDGYKSNVDDVIYDVRHHREILRNHKNVIQSLQNGLRFHQKWNFITSVALSIICVICLVFIFTKNASATDMIIGDSHVGGLKPYLNKHMVVKYKNGTTSAYWLKQPTYPVNNLVIHTGTNEQFNGTSPQKWLRQTQSLCWKWNPRKCYIVAPPMNKVKNYKAYRSVLYPQRNIIYTQSNDIRDVVHYKPSGYKQMAHQILSAIRTN